MTGPRPFIAMARLTACAIFFCALFLRNAPHAMAAPRPATTRFKAGDRVIWKFGSEELPGVVESIDDESGKATVRMDDPKYGETKTLPVKQFRRMPVKPTPGAADAASAASGSSSDSGQNKSSQTAPARKSSAGGSKEKAPAAKAPSDDADSAGDGSQQAGPDQVARRDGKSELRTWSDRSGKKIEATLVRADDKSVVLKPKHGKLITVMINKLSDGDQRFLKGVEVRSTGSGPDKKQPGAAPAVSSRPPATKSGVKITEFDIPKSLDLAATDAWTYTPDEPAAPKPPLARVSLGAEQPFISVSKLLVAGAKAKAVVTKRDMRVHDRVQVIVVDLESGSVESSAQFAQNLEPVDVAPDLSRVLACELSRIEFVEYFNLHLFDLDGAKLKLRGAWKPYAHQDELQVVLDYRLLGRDKVLTVSNTGLVIVWDAGDKLAPLYQLESRTLHPAISPQGKYLAVAVAAGIAILEPGSGEVAGFLPAETGDRSSLAFDAAGTQLALVDNSRIRVWDLASRELTADFDAGPWTGQRVEWVDHDYLLLDHRSVIDVPHRVVVQAYQAPPFAVQVGGDLWYVAEDDAAKEEVLDSGPLISDETRRVTAGLRAEDLLVLRPGVGVALQVQLPGFPKQRDKVVQDLQNQIVAAGMHVVEQSKYRLQVGLRPGMEMNVIYITHDNFRHQSTKTQSQMSAIELLIDGKSIWNRNGFVQPNFVAVKEGESLGQALDHAQAEQIAKLGESPLPKFVYQLPAGKAVLISKPPSAAAAR
jgi:hypothetical protein